VYSKRSIRADTGAEKVLQIFVQKSACPNSDIRCGATSGDKETIDCNNDEFLSGWAANLFVRFINVQTATHKTTLTHPLDFFPSDPHRMPPSTSSASLKWTPTWTWALKRKMVRNLSVIVDVCVRASCGSMDPGGFVRVCQPLQKCAVAAGAVIDCRLRTSNKV